MAYYNNSTAHTQDQAAKQHILAAARVSWDDHHDTPPASSEELCQHLEQRLHSEKGYMLNRPNANRAAICADWLRGLALNIEFMNHNILELAKAWGSLPAAPTERQEQAILANYWHYMAVKTLQLIDGYHVPKD